jgi:ribosomal protein L1
MAKNKRIKKAREGVDPAKAYSLDEAVKLVKECSPDLLVFELLS